LIEGLTEFLPVSSTGHLIIASAFMKIQNEEFIKCFNVIIQFGAILSVLALYWRRFLPSMEFYKKLIIAFLPAAVIGLLAKHKIDMLLESVQVVGWALLIGGIILIVTDKYFEEKTQNHTTIENLSLKQCVQIGLFQCLAMIPGTSRSAASIIGGMISGLSRKDAAEFSFFLAVPTMAGATFLQSLKLVHTIQPGQWGLLFSGIILSFIFALVTIRLFLPIISRYGYKHFGIYRILMGAIILVMAHKGLI
jgi:undecaprenyl-diphosphatase